MLTKSFPIFGNSAKEKLIPFEYKQLPALVLEGLIEGLLLGDGWQEVVGSQSKTHWKGGFTSSSKQLILDLSDCLFRLRKPHNINLDYIEKPPEGKEYPQGGLQKDTLRHYLTLLHGKQSWRFYKNHYLIPVSEIVNYITEEEDVFDLTIEDTAHYTASRILVHNTNELFRRLYPHIQRQIPRYNPIPNLMPDWLPGPGDRSPDIRHGDPFTKIPLGEERLPGPGFAALHPEMEGIAPEDYPHIWRLKILADVAPYSKKYAEHVVAVRAQIKRKELTRRKLGKPLIHISIRIDNILQPKKH
jgi:hypothetical protein